MVGEGRGVLVLIRPLHEVLVVRHYVRLPRTGPLTSLAALLDSLSLRHTSDPRVLKLC
jgi:hypothetical protein